MIFFFVNFISDKMLFFILNPHIFLALKAFIILYIPKETLMEYVYLF